MSKDLVNAFGKIALDQHVQTIVSKLDELIEQQKITNKYLSNAAEEEHTIQDIE